MGQINKDKTRAFIAVDFFDEDGGLKEILRLQEEIGKIKFKGKLTEPENIHLTLKFLGEIEESKLKDIKEKLREIKFDEFETHIDETGVFSFKGSPRIAWIKIGGRGIFELQKKIDDLLGGINVQKEDRFMGHLTLARIKYVADKSKFIEHINNLGVKKIRFKVKEFKLMKSELRPLGPVYSEIEKYLLDKSS